MSGNKCVIDWRRFGSSYHPSEQAPLQGPTISIDLPTRGLELSTISLWCNGPEWLKRNQLMNKYEHEMEPEQKGACRRSMIHNLVTTQYARIGELVKCEDYCSISCLYWVTAYLPRAVHLQLLSTRDPHTSRDYESIRVMDLWGTVYLGCWQEFL